MLDVVKKLFGTENLYEILQTTAEEANDPKKRKFLIASCIITKVRLSHWIRLEIQTVIIM